MKYPIEIADGVSFPDNLVTQSVTILAKRRVGKSFTMRRIWEQVLKRAQQTVVIDPKGDQWGIRSSADGKKAGFSVLILGGEHGDLPLEKTSGELVAKLVVEEQVNILLDTSMFSKTARASFMAEFLENLYRLKAQEKYRTPCCVVIDEADEIAPQRPQKGEERMLGAVDDIVRRGGQRGLGTILVTQRSASLNKNVLTQSEMLILLRTIAPQDLAAVKAWIDVHGTAEQREIIMSELPSLPIGDAYFWSPAWPTEEGMFKRAHVLPIETFDSAKTPEAGERRIIPKKLAEINLDSLRTQMAATIEKAKSNDPKLLQKEIARLSAELAKKPEPAKENYKEKRVEVPVITEAQLARLEKAVDRFGDLFDKHNNDAANLRDKLVDIVDPILKALYEVSKLPSSATASKYFGPAVKSIVKNVEKISQSTPAHRRAFDSSDGEIMDGSPSLTGPEQRILDGIAWANATGVERPANSLVAFLSGYSTPTSNGYKNPRAALVTAGLITYPIPGTVELTVEGKIQANHPDSVVSQSDLHTRILEALTGPQRRIMQVLIENNGVPVSNEDLAAAAGYTTPTSNGYKNPRAELRSYGLVEYTPEGVKAADLLFI